MLHILRKMSHIVLFIAKESFLDACVMPQMFTDVYANLSINAEQFKRAKTTKGHENGEAKYIQFVRN